MNTSQGIFAGLGCLANRNADDATKAKNRWNFQDRSRFLIEVFENYKTRDKDKPKKMTQKLSWLRPTPFISMRSFYLTTFHFSDTLKKSNQGNMLTAPKRKLGRLFSIWKGMAALVLNRFGGVTNDDESLKKRLLTTKIGVCIGLLTKQVSNC
jgi:hypothetical protein